jgi:hypothetical protein
MYPFAPSAILATLQSEIFHGVNRRERGMAGKNSGYFRQQDPLQQSLGPSGAFSQYGTA